MNAFGRWGDEPRASRSESDTIAWSHEKAKVHEGMNREPAHSISKRGRLGEGRPTKRTPEVVAKIAEAVAIGLTDEEASLLAGINPDTMTEWRKDPEFSGAIKRATAERLLMRLERIESGAQGWQGTAWAFERLYPQRFARPEVMNQIAVVNQGDKVSTERVIVLPGEEFDALIGRPGYHLCENGDLERREGSLVYVMVRRQPNTSNGRIAYGE